MYAKISFQQRLKDIQTAVKYVTKDNTNDDDISDGSMAGTMQLPLSWLEPAWKNKENRLVLCEHQQLPIGFIAQRWLDMTTTEKRVCCMHQTLTPDFLKGFWIHMSPSQKTLCYQEQQVPVELIREGWNSMSDIQKMLCTSKQHYFDKLSPGELSEFLVNSEWRIRRAAKKSMFKHIQKMKLKNTAGGCK